MRLFRYKREETLGAYNFGQYQIYVCTISNTKGELFKGISVLSSDSVVELPFPLSEEKARAFSSYLAAVCNGEVPSTFKLNGNWANLFSTIYFKFSKREGNMLNGRISLRILLGFRVVWVTVSTSSALACSQAINKLYGTSNA